MTPRTNFAALPYGHASNIITELTLQAINAAIPNAMCGSEWAEEYRRLSPERSYRASIGLDKFSFEQTPYMLEPTDCATSDPTVQRVTFIKSVQIAGTTLAENVIGYFIHADPSKIHYVCETEGKNKDFVKESLDPMIRDTPVLSGLVKDRRSRDSGNTLKGKKFPGGYLSMGWSTSAATLSSRYVRIVITDESDAYEYTKEGDSRDIVKRRSTTVGSSKKHIDISTPRIRLPAPPGSPPDTRRFSPIEFAYEQSDQRGLFVPCPQCNEFQLLEWERLNRDNAYFICNPHGCIIEEDYKSEMLAKHQWRARAPFKGHAGFYIWEAYSPWVQWLEIIEAYNEAERSGDLQKKKTFVNLSLARGWQDDDTPIETDDLLSRREPYYGFVPNGVLLITCSVDVQGNRIEVKAVGWGLNREKWILDYFVIEGDPADDPVWERLLNEVLVKQFEREDGLFMKIWSTTIDAGFLPQRVYKFCRANAGRRVYATMGSSIAGKPLISKPQIIGRPPVQRYTVGTETAKDDFAASLREKKHGPGFVHIPSHDTLFGKEYFKQLLSERPGVNDRGKRVWKLIKPGMRNEALDLMVGNYAAFQILGPPNLETMARLLRKKHEEKDPKEQRSEVGGQMSVPSASADGPTDAPATQSQPVPKGADNRTSTIVSEPGDGPSPAGRGQGEGGEAIATGSSDPSSESVPSASADGSSTLPAKVDADEDVRAPRRKKRRRRGRNFATGWKDW